MERIQRILHWICGMREATLRLWRFSLLLSCACAISSLALLYTVQSGAGDLFELLHEADALAKLPAVFLLSSVFLTFLTEEK